MKELARLLLLYALMLDDVVEQLAARRILHDQVEFLVCLDDLVQLNYMGMPDELQDVDFARHALDIGYVDDTLLL